MVSSDYSEVTPNHKISLSPPNDDYVDKRLKSLSSQRDSNDNITERTNIKRLLPDASMASMTNPGKILLPQDETLRNSSSFGDGFMSQRLSAVPTRDKKQSKR